MHEARVTEEGAQTFLRFTTPDGRINRIALRADLREAAAGLKDAVGKGKLKALALENVAMAVGFALGRWASGHHWRWDADRACAQFREGLLSLQGADLPTVTIALPASVQEAGPILRGVARTWPEASADAPLSVANSAVAGGVLLGLVFGEQEPELSDIAHVSAPPVQKGPLPRALLASLEPIRQEIVRKIRYGMPVESRIQELQASPIALQFPRAFSEWLQKAQQRGRKEKSLVGKLMQLAQTQGPDAPEVGNYVREISQNWSQFTFIAEKKLEFLRAGSRLRATARVETGSRVQAGTVDHRIQVQPPAPAWTLLIDESGDGGRKVFDYSRAALKKGYAPWLVGVLVPQGAALPPLPRGFHARNIPDPDTLDTRVQDLLDAPVGVLGLKVSALPISHGNAWLQSALELVRWTTRLLPLAGTTQLQVCIEQRGEYTPASDAQAIADEMMRQLAEVDPARAAQLQLSIRFVAKDASPYLGYADLLAFAWGQGSAHTRAMMSQSGLLGTCLLSGDAAALRQTWENIGAGRRPDAAAWQRMIDSPDAEVAGSLVRLALDRVAEVARADLHYWRSLCDGVLAHLDGRDVRLVVLGNAVAELERCRPKGEVLTPRLELAYRTARLWHANHMGAIDLVEARALDELGARLFEEVPALVCQADLVRAVAYTNLFEFSSATQALQRWHGQRPEVAGLQHHGRLLSTLGQHAAFQGNHAAALEHFEAALAAFGRLSEPGMTAREIWQTGTYQAIAAQDAGEEARELARQALEARAGALRLENIARWPVRADEPYIHHAVLRWLIACGSDAEREAYREAGGIWATEEYHPWPLIEAYRGLLFLEVGEDDQAGGFFESAVAIAWAPHQGPTVRYIGLALAHLGERLGVLEATGEVPREIEHLRRLLPRAPWDAFETQAPVRSLSEAWQWLGQALPFNFR